MSVVYFLVPDGFDLPERPSGGNVYDRRLAQGLADAGWSVRLRPVAGTWSSAEMSEAPGAPPSATVTDTLSAIPDAAVVLVDGLVARRTGALLLAQTNRLLVVVLVHQPTPAPDQQGTERALLNAARAVVTTSEWTRQWLLDSQALPPGRLSVAVPGADRAPLAPASSSGERLLCVAAVTREKGHDILVAALGSIREMRWRCTCVGALDRDEQLVHSLGVSPQGTLPGHPRLPVVFTGIRVGAALDATYADADLLVLPSRAETYGMVVTEALARGLPVVATEVGGVSEALGVVAAGPPGALVPPDDAEALGSALHAWLSDAGVRSRWRAAARERRTTLPHWSETSRLVAQVLAEVAA